MVKYPPFPIRTISGLAWDVLIGGKRSFRRDALRCTRDLRLAVRGGDLIPQDGPGVLLVNHYSRPGFFAGWIALALSAAVPCELTWVMTAAWTDSSTPWKRLQTVASEILFPRLARVYGHIPMPPMPPRPHETAARARAVRQILAAARQDPSDQYDPPDQQGPLDLLALAPEGMDPPDGVLMRPHPGVGRLLVRLQDAGCAFYPAGVFEEAEALVVNFGPRFAIQPLSNKGTDELDRHAADSAMRCIAALLPEVLRGAYN